MVVPRSMCTATLNQRRQVAPAAGCMELRFRHSAEWLPGVNILDSNAFKQAGLQSCTRHSLMEGSLAPCTSFAAVPVASSRWPSKLASSPEDIFRRLLSRAATTAPP